MRRRLGPSFAALVVLSAALSVVRVAAAPVGAPPPAFDPRFDKYDVAVSGTYIPLIGYFDCDSDPGDRGAGSEELGIIWYSPSGPDYLWTDLTPYGSSLARRQTQLAVNGTYTPLVGDFDGDHCDDVLWYGSGPARDQLWWGGAPGFTSAPINVGGVYRPVVGYFGGPVGAADGVFWYAPDGRESIWLPTGTRTSPFRSITAPQVGGRYYHPSWFYNVYTGHQLLLWYAPGPYADHLWRYSSGASGPGGFTNERDDAPVDIGGLYRAGGCGYWVVLHGPGPGLDQAAFRNFGLQYSPITIPGAYVTATTAGYDGCNIVWHAPGSAVDHVWLERLGG